jgi:hypothetical protein
VPQRARKCDAGVVFPSAQVKFSRGKNGILRSEKAENKNGTEWDLVKTSPLESVTGCRVY